MSSRQTSPEPAQKTHANKSPETQSEISEVSNTYTSSTEFSGRASGPYHGGRTLYSWQCCICGFVNKMSRVYGKRLQYPNEECDEDTFVEAAPKTFEALCQNHHTAKCAGRKSHGEGRVGVNHIRCDRRTPHNKEYFGDGTMSRRFGDGTGPRMPAPLETEMFKTFQDAGGKVRTPSRRRSEEISQQHSPYRPEKKEVQTRSAEDVRRTNDAPLTASVKE